MLWCLAESQQQTFDFFTELQRIESWEYIPLEIHWLTVDSVKVS